MKKHQFLFHKTPIDQHRLDGIDAVIADVLEVPQAGATKVLRLSNKTLQEMLIENQLSCPDSFRPDEPAQGNHVKMNFDKYGWERLNMICHSLGVLANLGKPVPKQAAIRISLQCCEQWLVQHAAHAEKVGGSYELLMAHAIVMCVQSGPGIGPTKLIKSAIWLENNALPEQA